MAGIGFELKKIYRKDGISRTVAGAAYSSMVVVGPTVVIITAILLLYLFLDMTSVGVARRELLSSTILYCFIFSVCLSTPFNAVFGRYIADKLFQEKLDDILSSYRAGLALVSALATLMALPVMLSLYFRGGIDLPFILAAFVLWSSIVVVFFSIGYLHATKDYKIIFIFFVLGIMIGSLVAVFLYFIVKIDQIHAILYGLALAFFLIAMCEFGYVHHSFPRGGHYTECLKYLWRERGVFVTEFLYFFSLYVHNFVLWTTPEHLYVANTYYSHMAYDMASCLAMFTNITATVIFTVIAETHFHDTYKVYMESIIGGTYTAIQKNKKIMFRTLSQQLGQVFAIQITITCVIFMFLMIFGLRLGFSSLTMRIYPVLAVAFLGVFLMYCNVVYMHYFEDHKGSLLTTFITFVVTAVGSVISAYWLPAEFYGAGLFVGMLCGWTYSYFRLRFMERNFEAHIFCRYKVVDTVRSSSRGRVVYRKGQENAG